MSMFKSLQSMPGVITLFHSPNVKASSDVLKVLQKATTSLESSPKSQGFLSKIFGGNSSKGVKPASRYQLDVASTFPTPDQFLFIKGTISTHPDCKAAFKSAFPKWGETLERARDVENLPTQSAVEKQTAGKTLDELVALKLFNPPLVVDWDNQLIASDVEGLTKVLEHYKKSEDI
ncbi:unnamed protein product [Kuraishia capsulata CBS 1993]|uniref:Thioredoxin-like fold domain-containing protein n=1 Tax=Kuraishia capsulata CBS 1993 TaxID=1382522 RepID=W6MHT6_9ASCO|nr:uncharacterized protein KUCA_T00001880001 [Kuraishia capsulata CBS 1993]CDK25909.1 unnamed protein product [Kuraishia capsulata CBS 1993]